MSWNNWDAPHFLYIAQHGYTNTGDPANFIVFPPLYPLTIKLLSLLIPNYLFSAILISIISLIIGAIIFYKLITKLWGKDVAKRSLFLLLIFPTSYFFIAPYTESLFFLITIISLWFAYKKNFLLAGIFGGLSFLTRHPGILLLPPLWVMIFNYKKNRFINLLKVTLPFLICIFLYLKLNFSLFGDPFAFRVILENHWVKKFTWPWNSLISSWRAVFTTTGDYQQIVGWWEAIPATFCLLFIIPVWKLIKRVEWKAWYTLTVLFITSTSFLLSTTRYLLVIPPLFVTIALISKKYPLLFYIWSFISGSLLTYFAFRYFTGQWAF